MPRGRVRRASAAPAQSAGVAALAAALLLCSLFAPSTAYILPGTYPTSYKRGQVLYADASSLISADTDLQYPYHALPICHAPTLEDEEDVEDEDGGHRRRTTRRRPASAGPYSFSVMTDARTVAACPPGRTAGADRPAAPPLTPAQAHDLASKIKAHYRVRLSLDGLPALVAGGGSNADPRAAAAAGPARPGFDLGFYRNGTAFINNHLLFRVRAYRIAGGAPAKGAAALLGGGRKGGPPPPGGGGGGDRPPTPPPPDAWLVVGFDVLACSIARPPGEAWADTPCAVGAAGAPPPPQAVAAGEGIPFTYDVFWEASPAGPSARWAAYLGPGGGGASSLLRRAHWLALANAAGALAALGAAAGGVLARTVRRDVAHARSGGSGGGGSLPGLPSPGGGGGGGRGSSASYFDAGGLGGGGAGKDDDGGGPHGGGGPHDGGGWRAAAGDVFRAPPAAAALAARFGAGVQVGLTMAAILALAAAGAVLPAARAAAPAVAAGALLAGSAAAGAAAVWLWGAATRSHAGWAGVAWRAGAHFPVPALAALAALNFVLHRAGADGAVPPATLAALAAGWAATGPPLALLGGAAAARRPPLVPPTRTNQIPRHVPPPPWGARPALLAATAGLLPFGACLLEARHAALAAWQGYPYAAFAFAAATGVAAAFIIALAAVVTAYAQLCAEDHRWWWAAHARGGAGALFGAAYCAVAGALALPAFLAAVGGAGAGAGAAVAGVAVYATYCGLGLWAAHLAGGAVGLGAALAFVRALFAAVKAE